MALAVGAAPGLAAVELAEKDHEGTVGGNVVAEYTGGAVRGAVMGGERVEGDERGFAGRTKGTRWGVRSGRRRRRARSRTRGGMDPTCGALKKQKSTDEMMRWYIATDGLRKGDLRGKKVVNGRKSGQKRYLSCRYVSRWEMQYIFG